MKYLLLLTLGWLLGSPALAGGNVDFYGTLGGFDEDAGTRSGAQIAGTYLHHDGYGFQVGGMIYDSNPDTDSTGVFTGYFATALAHIPSPVAPYVGLGVFAGEDERCTADEQGNSLCTEEYVIAFYPEVGIAFTIVSVQIAPFMRRFFDDENNFDPYNSYGINFSFQFE